jgi:hypothetical protein
MAGSAAARLGWHLGVVAGRLIGALRAPLVPIKPPRPFDPWREIGCLILWFVSGYFLLQILFAVFCFLLWLPRRARVK